MYELIETVLAVIGAAALVLFAAVWVWAIMVEKMDLDL